MTEQKFPLELNFVGDGRVFLNFWNAANGNDIVCQIVDGQLMLETNVECADPADDHLEIISKRISLQDFITLVESRGTTEIGQLPL